MTKELTSPTAGLDVRLVKRRQLPLIRQSEVAECGFACLTMCLNYWGANISLRTLRTKFKASNKGTTLRRLNEIARELNFHTRAARVDASEVHRLSCPSVLHFSNQHFVVLKKVSRGKFHIHDPAKGYVVLNKAEFEKRFTGVVLELHPTEAFQAGKPEETYGLRSVLRQVHGLAGPLLQIFAIGAMMQISLLLGPQFMRWVTDEALVSADRPLLATIAVAFLLLTAFNTGLTVLRSWLVAVMATSFNLQWMRNTFLKLMRLPVGYFEKRHLGDILSRFASLKQIQTALTQNSLDAVLDIILVTSSCVAIMLYSLQLSALTIGSFALYLGLRLVHIQWLRDATTTQIEASAAQTTYFVESIRGVASLKIAGELGNRSTTWSDKLIKQFNADLTLARFNVSYQAALTGLRGLENILVIWLGAYLVLDGTLTLGVLFAYLAYKGIFFDRAVALVEHGVVFKMLRLHLDRVADIAMEKDDSFEAAPGCAELPSKYDIEFRNVSFQYSADERPVLHNINLHIKEGDFIAITGESGCGKTTLVKLLLGLEQPTQGEIVLGGVPVRDIGGLAYRKLWGAVLQDDTLFTGTIAENIALHEGPPDYPKLKSATTMAQIADTIDSFPMKFNTYLGDHGAGLSGGQRQRLLLARALYRNPSLLLLDEATSHLDGINEAAVNAAVKSLRLTRITIAHRQETINSANRVIRLQAGVIAEDSAHIEAPSE